ncbi:uncharacterized protein LOC107037642 [Diachasma alloeum]|uniref:uncharacterized protein LOC107037642 n=1 Tax=Diachasma alloeum TaxID=454923 RepID=UPI0007382402|nr:uncharacterized protein LOC107037642 [Diachasma alloeum]
MGGFLWVPLLFVIPNSVSAGLCANKGGSADVTIKHSIYFDINSKSPLKVELDDSNRSPTNPVRFVSRGLPCSCQGLVCGCCAGINLAAFNFTRRACMEFIMVPEEFAMDVRLMIDDEEMFNNRLSARNPPPVCMPLYALPIVNFCVRLFDIRVVDSSLSTCMDFETKVAQWPVFILHFDCVRVGGNGLSWVRPNATLYSEPTVADVDIYDQVDFNAADLEISNSTSGLSPEEEDKIGTLKL